MVVELTLYRILGVHPTASRGDIKRAYQRKAKEIHPDKNPDDPTATEKFQALNEAYQVLKDPEKRDRYDKYGLESVKNENYTTFTKIFQFFRAATPRAKTEDISIDLNCSLEALYNGRKHFYNLTRTFICSDCKGLGTKNGRLPSECRQCGGTGIFTSTIYRGNILMTNKCTCPSCHGTGIRISESDRCSKCLGHKVIQKTEKFPVNIEAGMYPGELLVYPGEANQLPDVDPGDLIFTIKEKPHNFFKRNKDNLMCEIDLTLTQALNGYDIKIETLDNRIILLSQHEKTTRNGDIIKIPGEGMPVHSSNGQKGDLFVRFKLNLPDRDKIPKEVLEALNLHMPVPFPEIPEDAKIQHCRPIKSSSDEYHKTSNRRNHDSSREQSQEQGNENISCRIV